MNKHAPERWPWFDGWRCARGPSLRSLVERIAEAVSHHEKATGNRKRARRADDLSRFESALEVVIANLAHATLCGGCDSRLAILTGNKLQGFTRYENSALGKPLRGLLASLEALDLLGVAILSKTRCSVLHCAYRALFSHGPGPRGQPGGLRQARQGGGHSPLAQVRAWRQSECCEGA
jgi:hypothetical protein